MMAGATGECGRGVCLVRRTEAANTDTKIKRGVLLKGGRGRGGEGRLTEDGCGGPRFFYLVLRNVMRTGRPRCTTTSLRASFGIIVIMKFILHH
jgi:hypothetical protein